MAGSEKREGRKIDRRTARSERGLMRIALGRQMGRDTDMTCGGRLKTGKREKKKEEISEEQEATGGPGLPHRRNSLGS